MWVFDFINIVSTKACLYWSILIRRNEFWKYFSCKIFSIFFSNIITSAKSFRFNVPTIVVWEIFREKRWHLIFSVILSNFNESLIESSWNTTDLLLFYVSNWRRSVLKYSKNVQYCFELFPGFSQGILRSLFYSMMRLPVFNQGSSMMGK